MDFRHYDHDGRARFVTFTIRNRIPILANDTSRQTVVDAIAESVQVNRLRLLGYVIMPEHVHLVVVPPIELRLGPAIGLLKNKAAHGILRQLRTSASPLLPNFSVIRNGKIRSALWERRCYDHNCRTDDAVTVRINYYHNNPVIRKLVAEPQQYEWSSCRWYLGIEPVKLHMNPA